MAHNDSHIFTITLWPPHVYTHAHTNTLPSFDSVNMQA